MKGNHQNSARNLKNTVVRHCVLAVFLLFSVCLQAQSKFDSQQNADKAESQLKAMDQDSAKVTLLLKLSEWYRDSNVKFDKALLYGNKAFKLSRELGYGKGIAACYLKFSEIEQSRKNYEKASVFAQKAISGFMALNQYDELGESYVMGWSTATLLNKPVELRIEMLKKASEMFSLANNKFRSADCLKELGDILQSESRAGEALPILKKAEKIYLTGKDRQMSGIYDLLGTVYKQLGDNRNAIHYGLMAVKDAEKFGQKGLMLCTIYNRLGEAYYGIFEMEKALKCFQKSLSIAMEYKDFTSTYILFCNTTTLILTLRRDKEAKEFMLKTLKQHPELLPKDDVKVHCLLFEVYTRLKEKEKAAFYEKKMLEMLNKPNQETWVKVHICGFFVRRFITDKNVEKARYYCDIYSKLHENNIYQDQSIALHNWKFKIDSLSGNYLSAIRNYQLYKKDLDAAAIAESKRQVNQFNIIYETEKKDRNIQRLNRKKAQQQANLNYERKMRNIIIIVLILVVIILILAVIAYYEKQRTNILLRKKQEEINLKNNSLQQLVTEKEWLLREIHHRVKNNLHMVVGLLASQAEFIKGKEALQVIADSQHRVQAMSIIHQRLYQTDTLSHINMSDYIVELVTYLKSSFDADCDIRFDLKIEQHSFPLSHSIPIGLIINEAVTNAIKYAFPDAADCVISISLKNTNDTKFILEIRDNGIGMPESFDPEESNSLGMRLIDGLSHDIHADLKIYNEKGTLISLTFEMNDINLQPLAS